MSWQLSLATIFSRSDVPLLRWKRKPLSWQRLWDKSVGFMRGKDSKGAWREEPFDPLAATKTPDR